MKIKTKLFLSFLISGFVLIAFADIALYYFSAKFLKSGVYNHLESVAQSRTNHIKTYLDAIKNRILDFSSDGYINNCLNPPNGNDALNCAPEDLANYLTNKKMVLINELTELFIVNSKGIIIASTINKNFGLNKKDALYFKDGKKKPFLNALYSLKMPRHVLFVASAPIFKEDKFVGLVAGKFRPEKLYEILLDRSGLRTTGEIYLVNKEGFIISPSRFKQDAILRQKIDMNQIKEKFYLNKNYRKIPVLGTYIYLPEFEWNLLAEIDEKEVFAPVRQLLWIFVSIGLLSIFIFDIVSQRLSEKITTPIEDLQKGAEIIMEGNWDYRVGIDSEDAIGKLSRSFDNMTVKLKESSNRLEDKIKEQSENLNHSKQQNKLLVDTKKAVLNILEDLKNEREKLEGSEAKIRSVVENTVDGIIVINEEGIIDSFNPAAEQIFGYKAEEVIGHNIKKLMPEPYYSEHDQYLKRYKETGEKKIIGRKREVLGKRKNGTTFPLDLAVNEMRIGDRLMFTGILYDITERKKTQEQLRLQAAALENAANTIIITDFSGTIQWVNPAFTERTGYTIEEALGRTPGFLNSGKHDKSFFKNLWEVILSGRVWHEEVVNKRKDGSYYFADLTIAPVFSDEGKIVSFVGISQDITSRKLAEEQLIKQKENLEKVNVELDNFVYTASHDLRAPLRGIAGFATFLEEDYKDKLDKNGKDYIEGIRKGAIRLSNLIDDLLALSKISRIKNPYNNTQVNSLIKSICKRIEFDIKKHNVDIKIQENIPMIKCDNIKLGVVFLNLINNAIKFSAKKNKEKIKIEIGFNEREKFYEFFVKDNGIGIDPEYHKNIFGIFKRLHKQSDYDGTGVGLSLVKRIIEDHGGRIWIDSKRGAGATFYFTIQKDLGSNEKKYDLHVEEILHS